MVVAKKNNQVTGMFWGEKVFRGTRGAVRDCYDDSNLFVFKSVDVGRHSEKKAKACGR